MAIQQVQRIAMPDVEKSTSGRKSGGKFGTMAGLAAGAIGAGAVAATGGAALPAVIGAGAAGGMTGASLGGLLGESIRPGREASTAIERRIQTQGPQPIKSDASEKLRQSLVALHDAPPEVKSQYAPTLLNAYLMSVTGAGNKPQEA